MKRWLGQAGRTRRLMRYLAAASSCIAVIGGATFIYVFVAAELRIIDCFIETPTGFTGFFPAATQANEPIQMVDPPGDSHGPPPIPKRLVR